MSLVGDATGRVSHLSEDLTIERDLFPSEGFEGHGCNLLGSWLVPDRLRKRRASFAVMDGRLFARHGHVDDAAQERRFSLGDSRLRAMLRRVVGRQA